MNLSINWIGNLCIAGAVTSSLIGIFTGRHGVRRALYFNFAAMAVANLSMVIALLTNDFSVSYVAHVGARETPRFFAAISLWSSLEGSILFWGFVLSGYSALCMFVYRNRFEKLMPWVGIVLTLIGIFFYIVLALPANPFVPVSPVPLNGPGPNPLLQNHWLMGLHPPILYLGYVGMGVPFSFAMASLISGELTDDWVNITRRWTLTAWMFLSTAIILGGWWSYEVLGWGGYWAWDPVENASLMPWLTATAFLHSVMVQQRRQMLKIWNLALITTTFLLTLLGTFLTRSGVLESVHSFTQSDIGHYFLIFIAIALMSSIGLLLWKGGTFKSRGKLDHPLSRETFFLLNNLLLVCFCFVVFLGTLYPLVVEALQNKKVSVGEPFFNQMTVPLAAAIVLLMGIGSLVSWRKVDPQALKKKMRLPAILGVAGLAILFAAGIHKPWVLLLGAFAIFSFVISVMKIFESRSERTGGFIVHIGILVIAVGVAFSKSYQTEQQVTLKEGAVFQLAGETLKFEKLKARHNPQRFEVIAEIKNEAKGFVMEPRLNFYPQNREPIGSPDVRSTPMGDLYLTLMAFDSERHEVSLRAIATPLVSWIWIGGGIIIVGALIAMRGRKKNEGPSP